MNKETRLQWLIMLALSEQGHTVWRNETGRFWTGKVIHQDSRTVTLANASMVPVGLCVGSSDLIGIQKGTGLFSAVEVKTDDGRVSPEQRQFIDHVIAAGGIAGVCRSVDEAVTLLRGGR